MRKKLTKRSLEAVVPAAQDQFLWDIEQPGLGVKITPAGRRVYLFQYSYAGRDRRYTIGQHGAAFTLEEARREAKQLRGLLAKGQDPVADKARLRSLPTLVEFADRYIREHADLHKKARSAQGDRSLIENHLRPLLGRTRIDQVTREMVTRAAHDIAAGKTARDEKTVPRGRRVVRGGAVAANRALTVLSKMMNLAELWGLRPASSNPCRFVARFAEEKRQRFLSTDELGRLGRAMSAADKAGSVDKTSLAAISLLILTGCRLREILDLRWEHVDFERRLLHLPDSKTGAKTIYLAPEALKILGRLPKRDGFTCVLPRRSEDKPLSGLKKAWDKLRDAAELRDVRLHDLRHSFASVGAGGGLSLPVIGALLGHSQVQTTQRYAHLVADPLHKAAALIGGEIAAAMSAKAKRARKPGAASRAARDVR